MRKLVREKSGVVRFKRNVIVGRLLEESQKRGFGLNELAVIGELEGFSQADWEDFYQAIGYSLAGYHELPNVSDESAREASAEAQKSFAGVGGCRDLPNPCPIHTGVEREVEL